MFPTTMWSTIREAAARDGDALERFAERYRPPIVTFLRSRGFSDSDADDLCQDVFMRVLAGEVLAKADPERGRLRSLLLAVTTHVIGDHARKRGRNRARTSLDETALGPTSNDPDFDAEWVLHITETAFARLQAESPTQYQVLCEHLVGQKQERRGLWRARRKLVAVIRREIALTCASHREFEDEVAYLNRYIRPAGERIDQNNETITREVRSMDEVS